MATQCFLTDEYQDTFQTGARPVLLDGGNATKWWPYRLRTTRGLAANPLIAAPTVAGATPGVELQSDGTDVAQFISYPLAADVTISGTITCNIWAHENNMSANAAINVRIFKIDGATLAVTEIAKTTRTTELATASAVNNFTVTPTSTACKRGDRLMVHLFIDDAGTMASGFSATATIAGTTAAADGDSYVTFTETFSFDSTSTPAGTQLFLTNNAGPDVGAATEYEMWTSRGGGVTTATRAVSAGPISPTRLQVSSNDIEWYSRRLNTFTLAGSIKCNLRGAATASTGFSRFLAFHCELAIVENDGSGAVVVAQAVFGKTNDFEIGGTAEQTAGVGLLAVDDVVVANGQRLRLRVSVDDGGQACTADTMTMWFNGTSGGASGDSWIQLSQSVTEFTPPPSGPVFIPPHRRRANRYCTIR